MLAGKGHRGRTFRNYNNLEYLSLAGPILYAGRKRVALSAGVHDAGCGYRVPAKAATHLSTRGPARDAVCKQRMFKSHASDFEASSSWCIRIPLLSVKVIHAFTHRGSSHSLSRVFFANIGFAP